eukprot:scaffold54662_cov60-Phaeocystis_antarctica.AAC.2
MSLPETAPASFRPDAAAYWPRLTVPVRTCVMSTSTTPASCERLSTFVSSGSAGALPEPKAAMHMPLTVGASGNFDVGPVSIASTVEGSMPGYSLRELLLALELHARQGDRVLRRRHGKLVLRRVRDRDTVAADLRVVGRLEAVDLVRIHLDGPRTRDDALVEGDDNSGDVRGCGHGDGGHQVEDSVVAAVEERDLRASDHDGLG